MDVILDRFALLEKVIRLSNSTVDIERRLASLLQLLRREMQVERVCLFDLDREAGILALRTLTDENGVPPDLRVPMADNLLGRAAMRQEPAMAGPEGIEALPEATRLFFTGFQTLAVFPIMDDMQLYGVLTFLHRDALSYDPGRIMLIEAMARVMAGTIRNSRLYAESKKRIAELSVLNDVGRSISLTIDLKEVLDTVVKITAKVLMARGSSLNVLDEKTGALRVSAVYGAVPPACLAAEIAPSGDQGPSDHAIACASRREPYVGPACKDPLCEAMGEYGGDRSMICIPLHFTGNYKGALCLYDKFSAPPGRSREFGREDLELLSTMGTMISSSVENALTFQTVNRLARHNETLVRNLSCLYEISGAMMTTFYLDELLAIITNALTLRQGLGFDRALVLLVDEDEESLMGAALREVPIEARETNDRSLADMLRDPAPEPEPSDRLAAFFDLRLPLKEAGGVLVRTAATKQIFNVSPNNGDHDVESSLPVDFGRLAFTTVPMVAKGKVVGVIAVDRDHSAQEITSEDVRNLSMMANQAALAIENSRLYEYIEHANTELTQTRERLLEAEKLAALGEMGAGMAHEIRNPLVSIGGFTRRLLKSLDEGSPLRVYIEVIINEVSRLEKTLNEVLDFARDTLGHLVESDLNEIVSDALYILRREFKDSNIEVIKDFSELQPVLVDERQIKHVFFSLFFNAIQAMDAGGVLTLKTYRTRIEDRSFAACDVSDTGPGIKPEILPNIFNPFFTTKDSGTGLGLSIVHRIVSRHGGQIDVVNRPDGGATFSVKLPEAAKAGLYLK